MIRTVAGRPGSQFHRSDHTSVPLAAAVDRSRIRIRGWRKLCVGVPPAGRTAGNGRYDRAIGMDWNRAKMPLSKR